jgi:exonuclease SbcD
MRVIHTSDWHLGRSFHGASLAAEQAAALAAIVDVVRAERVDVVIVAGDLYDRQLPPLDAVRLLSEALQELRRAGATVVAVAGNHDSARRLQFAEGLLAAQGVHLRGDVRTCGQPVMVPSTDGGPDLAVYPVPYLEPEAARHQLGAPEVRSHHGLLNLALERARTDLAARGPHRSIAVAHAFVAGGTPCDSERVLAVGGSDRVPLRCMAGFDYVALGHLHGRQTFADGRVRYAGSPLAYSFSERDHRKGVWLVDLPRSGPVRVQAVDLHVGRRLVAVRGGLDALLGDPRHAAAEDAWVAVTLTDAVLPRDAMGRLRRRFPHALTLAHEPPAGSGDGTASYRERVRGRDDLALVDGFVAHVTGRALNPQERDDCATALDEVTRYEAA